MSPEQMEHIFEPFYTTKTDNRAGEKPRSRAVFLQESAGKSRSRYSGAIQTDGRNGFYNQLAAGLLIRYTWQNSKGMNL